MPWQAQLQNAYETARTTSRSFYFFLFFFNDFTIIVRPDHAGSLLVCSHHRSRPSNLKLTRGSDRQPFQTFSVSCKNRFSLQPADYHTRYFRKTLKVWQVEKREICCGETKSSKSAHSRDRCRRWICFDFFPQSQRFLQFFRSLTSTRKSATASWWHDNREVIAEVNTVEKNDQPRSSPSYPKKINIKITTVGKAEGNPNNRESMTTSALDGWLWFSAPKAP